jgi:hypothetical protein
MFIKLSPRERMLLMIAAGATALFLIIQFVVFPLLDQSAPGPEAVLQKESALRRDQRLLAQARGEQARIAVAEDRLKALEAGLLESPSPSLANAEWQSLVGQLADNKGIELGSSEFLRRQDLGSGYALVTGRVQFRCRPDQLVDFLVAVASSPKLLAVTGMGMSAIQGDPEKKLTVELTIGAATRAVAPAKNAAAEGR